MAYGRIAGINKMTLNYGSCSNKTIILTMDNEILFCGDITGLTVAADVVIATIPTTFAPANDVCFVVYASIPGNATVYYRIIKITPTGEISTNQPLGNATLHLNGICVHINDKFYNDTIGNNNETTMTYPIGRL